MPRVCCTQAVNSGKHREINQHPRKKWYESKIYHGKSDKIRKHSKTYFLPLFPVGGTSVYPVDKQQPRTGRTKLILAVSAFNFFRSVHCVLPFVSTQCFLSVHCLLPFVSPLPFHALLLSFHSMSYIPFVASSHSFQLFVSFPLFVSVHCVLSFHFTFPLLCVPSVRSFQVLYPVRFFFPFVSTLPCRLLRPSF